MALLLESTTFIILFFSFVHYTNRAVIHKNQKVAVETLEALDSTKPEEINEPSEESNESEKKE